MEKGKAGGSQLLNTAMGQIFALPGNTQTMMIGRLYCIFKRSNWVRQETPIFSTEPQGRYLPFLDEI